MSSLRALDDRCAPVPPHPKQSGVELESVDCPLCGGEDHETVVVASDPVTKIGGNFRVVRCRDCSFSFTNPRPTVQSIGQFYPDSYGPYTGRDHDSHSSGTLYRSLTRKVMQADFDYPSQSIDLKTRLLAALGRATIRRSRQRQFWIPFRAPGRLLDFGCGAGDFLKRMKELGWTVEGMDFSEKVAREIFQSSGIRVHIGSLPHPAIEPESFDAVTMWNSLEHVHQPREVVRDAGKALRRGGLLVVGVPNFDSWSYENFRESWYALELPRHLNHFTPDTLCETVKREGFKVLSMQQIARAGCLRKSARRATSSGFGPAWLRAARWKPWGQFLANRSERIGRADFMRVIAEKL